MQKTKAINNISELEIGKEYKVYSKQFNCTNKHRWLGNNNHIKGKGYFATNDKETPQSLKEKFERNVSANCFCLWEHEINLIYIITPVE